MVPIFKDGIWKLEALSDSDFANDKDTRYCVYGYIIYFCGILVVWKSKSMKSVVGSHQVPFPMCTLETLQKNCSTSSLLLIFCLSLF